MPMTDDMRTLNRRVGDRTVHCRHHVKSDGRDLFLYGYTPHTGQRLPGDDLHTVTGSEMRHHPLRGEWSIYAAGRQNRTFKPGAAANPLAPSRPGAPLTEIPFEDFELAVFGNRFPSLFADATPPDQSDLPEQPGLNVHAAKGACEVIVYSPRANGSLATLSQSRRRLLIEAWIDRYEAMFSAGCAFVLPFENRGDEVGVTLHHPHGQIYGFPIVPQPQQTAAHAFEAGYDLAAEVRSWGAPYEIQNAGGMVSYAPRFARFPYEVWISAETPVSGPWAFTEDQADGFAHLLGDTVRRYDAFFGRETPCMLSLHAAPYGRDDRFQFTAQFYPLLRAPDRVKYLASVEQATGVFTVDVLPSQAADQLRGAL
ncbi:MAG: galactose-1-phosphate uridylyltransferase [Pseudomonadota bacterium]